ncbi:hypothetical protein BH23GEM1_BH23GEM1_00050 [soil metagenome]
MQRKRIIAAGAALLVIVAAGWMFTRDSEKESPYRFAAVERGDLEASVSATGKLGAVTTVQVGTQVSGQVSAIFVDFNDRVRKGQLIARIDPTLQQQAVRDALAGLEAQINEYVEAGVRPIADLYQQQAVVASSRLAVVDADRAAQLAEVDLMQTLQLDPRGEYEFVAPEFDEAASTQQYQFDSLLVRAIAQRVDLDAEEIRLEAAEQQLRAARAGRRPALSLSAGYNTAYSSATELNFFDQLDQRRGGSVGLGLSLPILDRAGTSIATQRARIAADNARIAVEDRRQEVALQVRRAQLDFQSAQEQLRAAEAQQRAAELALQTVQERYEVGAATLVELTQARAVGVQAASAIVSARYNLLFQRTLMDYYIGVLNPEVVR